MPATLALLAELDPERQVAVCRELTKVHEEIVRGTASELAGRWADAPPKGEVVLVLGPAGVGLAGAAEPAGLDAAAAAGGGRGESGRLRPWWPS